jgi:cytochrome P450 family 9
MFDGVSRRVFGFFNFLTPNFVIADVELVKQITLKDFSSFINHDKMFNENIDSVMSKTLFSLFDDNWRVMREALSPIFSNSNMKMMFDEASRCARDFVTHLENKAPSGKVIVDARDTFARYTIEGISTAALGFKSDCVVNQDSSLFKMASSITSPPVSTIINFLIASTSKPFYTFLRLQIFTKELKNFFRNVIVDAMNERGATGISRPDIIQLLIQAKKGKIEAREDDGKDLKNFSANIEHDVGVKANKAINWTDEHFMAQGWANLISLTV